MALNKRKVLEAARKHAQKGAKAKALKEYNKLLQADPRDAKLLLEVGDAYRRWGQAEEAIAQYGKVAQQYRQDGFDARAVAVFKQILNLDPKHYAAYVSLSELYQRMGLDSEAISALQTAADGYHKEGRKAEALDLLRQMAALDPTNTTSRLKVAELLRQEEMNDEALSEYEAVAAELESQQDRDQLISVQERILELKPDRIEALTGLVRNLMATGALDRAEPLAVRSLNVSADPAQYELLIDLYAQMGDDAKLADATRGLAKLFRDRGDDEKARELMQRLPAEEVSSSSRLAVDVSEVAEPDLADEELLDEEPFLEMAADGAEPVLDLVSDAEIGMPPGEEIEELVLDMGVPEPEAPVATATLPEGDPDQLLAEASVYLRYGKREQAIASLRAVIAQEPDHRGALEKLGEAYADDGQQAAAVETWLAAAEQVRLAGDAEGLAVLKDRVAALDPAAAEQIGSVEAVADATAEASALDVAPQAEMELDLEVEMDLDLDTAIEEVASSETQSGLEFGDSDAVFEIELDDDSAAFDGPLVEETSGTDASTTAETDSSLERDLSLSDVTEEQEFEFELDLDDAGEDESSDSQAVEAAPVSSASSSANIDEELEEAEFYIAQDMYDEAEAILERVLALAPNHPSALLRMGEVAAAKGDAPDVALSEAGIEVSGEITSSAEIVGPDRTEPDFDITARLGEEEEDAEFEIDVDLADFADFADDADEDEAGEPDDTTSTTPQVVLSSPEEDEPESVSATTEPMDAAEAHLEPEPSVSDPATPPLATAQEPAESIPSLPEHPQAAPAQPAFDPEDSFDLREALADVLEEDDAGRSVSENETSGVLSTVEDGFESIFSDFKKGVSATLEEGDFDTRYDLGIAYREMGLFEDAIGEFRVCSESPARRFDSLYLMGLCARDLLRFDDAVNHLEQALALPDIPDERLAGVYFDLSIAHEGAGDAERASSTLRRVIEIEPDFPGAAERLATLASDEPEAPDLGEPGEGFESFDDLFSGDDEDGDDAIVEAVPLETFESFDDVMSEDTSSAEPAPEEHTQSPRKGGRKKISFV